MRIGTGYDVHRLVPDRKMIIGGVRNWHKNNEIADVVIIADVKDIKDKEIIDLINELPKFKSMR